MSVSAQGDNELRDLVTETLENTGLLSKIRAELRASVFLVLEEHETFKGRTISFANNPLNDFLSTNEGIIVLSLVKELLDYFSLEFSANVFDPETRVGTNYEYIGRNKLAQILNLNSGKMAPLIAQLLQQNKFNCSAAAPKEDLKETLKKEQDDNNQVKDKDSLMKRDFPASYDNGSQESIVKQVTSTDNSKAYSPFQNHIKKNENLIMDLNQLVPRQTGSTLSSLSSLPPLGTTQHIMNKNVINQNSNLVPNDIKCLLDLGSDSLDQNYDEDFHASGSEKASKETNRSLSGSGSEIEEEVSAGIYDLTTDGSNASEKT